MNDIDAKPDGKTPYECFDCGTIIVAETTPSQCPDCGGPMRNRQFPLE
jgi:rubrerythrin